MRPKRSSASRTAASIWSWRVTSRATTSTRSLVSSARDSGRRAVADDAGEAARGPGVAHLPHLAANYPSGNDEREASVSQCARGVLDANRELIGWAVGALAVGHPRNQSWRGVGAGFARDCSFKLDEPRYVFEHEAVDA